MWSGFPKPTVLTFGKRREKWSPNRTTPALLQHACTAVAKCLLGVTCAFRVTSSGSDDEEQQWQRQQQQADLECAQVPVGKRHHNPDRLGSGVALRSTPYLNVNLRYSPYVGKLHNSLTPYPNADLIYLVLWAMAAPGRPEAILLLIGH
ncbi:hypothetical protein BDN72DRAFT_865791 [Pluteus cervinus]|uniref:Uncharacterized protein n=1 Tax=Pluteus cervinus TaxID=181527 RepID=A0ACD2ZZM6_9AGAR|nr:hypothetical protein BDN72DRAFT_865791 [Pluteus cervinus]